MHSVACAYLTLQLGLIAWPTSLFSVPICICSPLEFAEPKHFLSVSHCCYVNGEHERLNNPFIQALSFHFGA